MAEDITEDTVQKKMGRQCGHSGVNTGGRGQYVINCRTESRQNA
jgi:hypothetical protein